MKEPIVGKPIIANNVTRNLANLFQRKSKKPFCCKQCGKNFSYLLFLEKKYAKFLVTLFAMMGFLTMGSFMGLVRNPLGAGKWLFSCVCPLMLLQITILLKCFCT